MGNGPTSWSAAKRRLKRPETKEQKKSHEQNVGRLPRQTCSKPAQPAALPRSAGAIQKPRSVPLQRDEKRLRALNKLLRGIEELQAREANGETLDEQQLAKVARLDDTLTEMESLVGG